MKQFFSIKAIFSLFAIISANLAYGLYTSNEKEAIAIGEKLPLSIGMNGTLIDSRVVLTSASAGNPKIMVFEQNYVVIKSVPHPKWKKGELGYDFQLLFLDRPVLNVQPIKRARVGSGALDNQKVLVAGTSLLERNPYSLFPGIFFDFPDRSDVFGFKSAGYNVIKTLKELPQLLIPSNSEAEQRNILPTAMPKPVDNGAGIFLVEETPGVNAKYQLVGVASDEIPNIPVIGNVTDLEVNTWIDNQIIQEALAPPLTKAEIETIVKDTALMMNKLSENANKLFTALRSITKIK